ncbi:hypothetical protein FVEN_g8195 [Fusarium venenatum]|nr:hypothetical protein FVEN_g8195 [Fusarium venenatum]
MDSNYPGPLPPPSYSEATTTDPFTTVSFGVVSPVTTSSSPVPFNVTVSPMATPPLSSRSIEELPNSQTYLFNHNVSAGQFDTDCSLEAVVPDGLELAVMEHSADRDILPIAYESTSQISNAEYESGLEVMAVTPPVKTVTPLHLLGDQPESIDCPYCLRRSETRVRKKPSSTTHLQAVALLMTTVCGAAAPYMKKWSFDIEQFCQNCNNRVMYRARGKDIRICKVPESWKEESKLPDADGDISKRW